MSLLLFGFLIGIRHALEADHVAALAALATSSNSVKQVLKQGAVWGLGHTFTLFLFGTIVVGLEITLPETLAQGLEFVVGIMLILLGADVMRRMIKDRNCRRRIHHTGTAHRPVPEPPCAAQSTRQYPTSSVMRGFPIRALMVGIMHGMAGSAALIILSLNTVDSLFLALLYMLLFGFGSIFGMVFLSIIIAFPLRVTAQSVGWAHQSLQTAIGLATVVFGAMLVYEVGLAGILI